MARSLALILVFTACAAAARPIARATSRPEAWVVDITRPAAETCGGCHADVYAEWDPGLHHRSWTNDNILRMTDRFAQVECRACHSPQAVLPAGLVKDPGEASPWPHEPFSKFRGPAFREERVEEGVHCLSCHGLADGSGVAALHDVPDAPCRPRRDERLASVALCASCHDPTHQAEQDYEASPAPGRGLQCMDCHMAEVERPHGRAGHSHVFPGGFNPDQVRDGVHAEIRLEGREAVVTLANRTGHKFPGEIPSRSLEVDVIAYDAAGARVHEGGGDVIRRSLKNPSEKDRPDNRLKPGETRVVRDAIREASAVRVVVTVLFRSLPLQARSHAILIAEQEFALK